MREWMQGKFHERLKKTAAKPEAANGIRKKERSFYTDKEELFTFPLRKTYGSAMGNVRFARRKHTFHQRKTKNNGNVTRFSTRGLQKNWLQMKS